MVLFPFENQDRQIRASSSWYFLSRSLCHLWFESSRLLQQPGPEARDCVVNTEGLINSWKKRWFSSLTEKQKSLGLEISLTNYGRKWACNSGDTSLNLALEDSPGGGHGSPLQDSCLENPIDRGAWQATVHRVAKSGTWLKWLSMHAGTLSLVKSAGRTQSLRTWIFKNRF